MAGISDNGAFNSSLGNISSQNFGPTATAQQGLIQAQTAQTQQQTQMSQIQTAQAALNYQMARNALTDFRGQPGGNFTSDALWNGASDKSGTAAPRSAAPSQNAAPSSGPTPSSGPAPQSAAPSSGPAPPQSAGGAAPQDGSVVPPTGAAPPTGGDQPDVGLSPADPAAMAVAMRKTYGDAQNPMGTQQEQDMVARGAAWTAATGDASKENAAKLMRDQNVTARRYQSQQDALKHSDMLDAVVTADKPFKALQAVAPTAAYALRQAYPDDSDAQLNERARHWAAHVESNIQQYTGVTPQKGDDNVYRNPNTGAPIHGIPIQGMSPEKYDAAIDQLSQLRDVKDPNTGQVSQVPVYKTIDPRFTSAFDALSTMNQHNQAQANMPSHPAFAGTPAGQPGATAADFQATARAHNAQGVIPGANGLVPKINSAQPPAPASGGASQQGAPQGGAPGQPGAPQPGAGAGAPQGAPGASAPQQGAPGAPGAAPDNGMLPGVDPIKLPKPNTQRAQLAPGAVGGSPGFDTEITAKDIATKRGAQLQAANDASIEDQKTGALIRAAQRDATALQNNPRMVGPGSDLAQGVAKLTAYAKGLPPDALIESGELDKMTQLLGSQNVRQALAGMKITQQEYMAMLTKGNPNTGQPLALINRLLTYNAAQNDYDQRFQKTKKIALNYGADPRTVDSDIGEIANRGDYVESRAGVRPPLGGGQGGQGAAASQPDSGGFVPGKQYKDKNGNTATYAGNGKWQ
jgi:hypothetical protein